MSYRRYSLGNSISRGFGLAAGFAIFNFVAGVIVAMTAGLWLATGQINPMARWIVRSVPIAVLAVGNLMLLADL
jgi:hypothetical protein